MLNSIATSMLSAQGSQLHSHGFLMDDGWASLCNLPNVSVQNCISGNWSDTLFLCFNNVAGTVALANSLIFMSSVYSESGDMSQR